MKLWKVAVVLAAVAMFSIPANAQDTCASASLAVAGGAGVSADPCGSVVDGGPVGSCAGGQPAIKDAWVKFVATSATHRIRTDIGSNGTDSNFGVYDACGGTEIGCSEDECFNGVNFCASQLCDGVRQSPWLGNICQGGLTPGNTYYIQVGTFADGCPPFAFDYNVLVQGDGNTCGDGVLACDGSEECEFDHQCPTGVCSGCACVAPCPSTCETAVDVGVPTSNCGAGGAEAGETLVDPCCDTDPTGPLTGDCPHSNGVNDLWLTFVAPASGVRVRSDVASSGTDSSFDVFSGGCGALTEVACSEDEAGYNGDILIVGLTEGETYHIQLGSWNDGCASYGITISGIPGAVCGDGIWAPVVGEACDGDDAVACPTLCTPECTCPDPICGNGVKEDGEQCDLGAENGEAGCQPVDCDCTADCKTPSDIVPAISEWGLVVMVLIGLVAGTVMFGRKRAATA